MKVLIIFVLGLLLGIGLFIFYTKETTVSFTRKTIQEHAKSLPQFSIENAPTQSIIGTVATSSGIIQWQSRTATQPATVIPKKIQQGEQVRTEDFSAFSVSFINAGTVSLLPNTIMDFIQTLPQNIVIIQSSGTSEIERTGSVPITVKSYDLLTEIDSGDTTISFDSLRPIVTVTVASGSATVAYNDSSYTSNVFIIHKNQSFVYNSGRKTGTVE